MDPVRWQAVCDLLAEAVLLSGRERERFLDERCVSDPAMRAEVQSLILSHEQASTFLDGPAITAVSGIGEGTEIGAFRIIRSLGEGGMGAVYLAERIDEAFEHHVAIKLLRPGGAHGDLVDRFRRERQILASLDHPHIAMLLDGGNTPDGLPYLVMEYVEGTPFDNYCSQNEPSLRELSRFFVRFATPCTSPIKISSFTVT